MLNGSSDRTYYLGLEDNSDFYIIASDGGLLSAPAQTNRVRISPGERVEILVDFSAYSVGNQINFKSFSSELPYGIIGADTVGTFDMPMGEGYYSNPLNGADFNILRFDIISPTTSPVTTIPTSFAPKIPLLEANADEFRTLIFEADTVMGMGQIAQVDGPFMIDNEYFHMDSINITVNLNSTEVWSLINTTLVAHPFHIHDIQFFVLDINGNPPPPQYEGLKDVILVEPGDTVRFITQFITFSDFFVPYMYHCHLLHHEDEGMMGSFLVIDTTQLAINEQSVYEPHILVYPNPARDFFTIETSSKSGQLKVYNLQGAIVHQQELIENSTTIAASWVPGIYLVEIYIGDSLIRRRVVIE